MASWGAQRSAVLMDGSALFFSIRHAHLAESLDHLALVGLLCRTFGDASRPGPQRLAQGPPSAHQAAPCPEKPIPCGSCGRRPLSGTSPRCGSSRTSKTRSASRFSPPIAS
jgi:hypothetical protein